jgi:hypothetical protein
MIYTYGGSGCVTAHVNRYLTSLRLPPRPVHDHLSGCGSVK